MDFDDQIPLNFTVSNARRHSFFYKNHSRWYNYGKLRQADLLQDIELIKCPSYGQTSRFNDDVMGFGSDWKTLESADGSLPTAVWSTY